MTRNIDYYVDVLKEKYYPHLPKKMIKRILLEGFEKFYNLNTKHVDTYHKDYRYTAFCGYVFRDLQKNAYYKGDRGTYKARYQ